MRENFRRRKRTGWEVARNAQMTGKRSLSAVINHRNAVHNGVYDPTCPACRELERKTGAKEKL